MSDYEDEEFDNYEDEGFEVSKHAVCNTTGRDTVTAAVGRVGRDMSSHQMLRRAVMFSPHGPLMAPKEMCPLAGRGGRGGRVRCAASV